MGIETGTIHARLNAVMQEVTAVAKKEKNQQQNFNFRGIDAVVNAVGPALRQHGVIVTPNVIDYEYGTVEVGQKRTPMAHVRVKVRYEFFGIEGDSISATVVGEAMDSGDKATAKAMSVAFRIALLQSLALPTDERDPDHDTYERSPKVIVNPVDLANKVSEIAEITDEIALKELFDSCVESGIIDEVAADGETLRGHVMNRLHQLRQTDAD